MLDHVLPVEDHETAAVVEKSFKQEGIDCRVSTAVENIKVNAKSVKMDLVKGTRLRVSRLIRFFWLLESSQYRRPAFAAR